ncbi:D-amino acid dehydrogenase [Albitalea terrae]|uniref:D-amino acid dehydrogenase n=2 Tax=Piscinibacter terrae TaxID=2496871 RepID=A0A3N7HTG3_9BURK|nr:D-amino acid dehydrogenase [Albitalea terrae]
MKVIVLGAGVIGVTTAWYLNRAGHEVTVLERNAAAACETSFANGGQISVSHAEPWANPSAPWKVLKWLGRDDAPLLFRLRADPAQWRWMLRFLLECAAGRSRANMIQLLRLGTHSRTCLQQLRRELSIDYDQRTQGILHFYTDAREFDAAIEPARVMRELGCERRVIDRDEVLRIEPAMAAIASRIVGATYTSEDESGDVHRFTTALAEHAAKAGVVFRHGVRVQALHTRAGQADGVEVAREDGGYETLHADAFVVAMGSHSTALLRSAGIDVPVYPAKGYSATLPVIDESRAPSVSLTDDEYKLVFSRLGNRLRVAGTAELSGHSLALNRTRCEAIVKRALEVFPGCSRPELASFWAGLRPATPGNVPLIGPSRLKRLFLNTGHGTLGWTHACGSAQALADLVSGRRPEVDFAFLRI